MKEKVINALMFKIGWLGVVLLGTGQFYWLAPVLVAAIVMVHLSMCHLGSAELKLIASALAIGLVWESLITQLGVVVYPNHAASSLFAPVWIVSMWALLATSLNVNLRWLQNNPIPTILFGAVGGPFAFLAGEKLGAVILPNVALAVTTLAIGWSIAMILLVALARRFDGFNPSEKSPSVKVLKEAQYEI